MEHKSRPKLTKGKTKIKTRNSKQVPIKLFSGPKLESIENSYPKRIKAFICAGNYHEYRCFINENHLSEYRYPMLTEENWRGIHIGDGVEVIRIGTFYMNKQILDKISYIEIYLSGR